MPLTVSYVTDTDTYSIDLSQSWTIDTVNANIISKPQAMTPVRRPPLWYDPQANSVMERGGWAYTAGASYFLWSFTPDGQGGGQWSLDQSSAAAQLLLATFGGAFTTSPTGFYSLGGAVPGALNTSSDSLNPYGFAATEGLITYDFASGGWNNISSFGGSQTGYSVQAQAVSMPNFGKAGLLAFFGGDSPSNQSYLYEAGAALVDMSNITVYDTHSDTWYYQTATGDVPPPRSEFCAVSSSPTDNSSYEVYVFGGSTNSTIDVADADDTGYLDVFVLSMPAFRWFKTDAPTESRRANHFCQIIGQRQMLVIGGRDPSSDGSFWPNDADPWTRGLNIFDMTGLKWTNAYNASAKKYEQPAIVKKYYTNHANETNWSEPALAALFTPRSNLSNTTSPPPPSPSPAHHTNTGAIVGGIVGGIAGLICLALFAFFLFRRRSRQTRVAQAGPVHEMSSPPPQQEQQKYYEMDSQAVEMPAENQDALKPNLNPSHTLQELDSSGDQNVRVKPVSYA